MSGNHTQEGGIGTVQRKLGRPKSLWTHWNLGTNLTYNPIDFSSPHILVFFPCRFLYEQMPIYSGLSTQLHCVDIHLGYLFSTSHLLSILKYLITMHCTYTNFSNNIISSIFIQKLASSYQFLARGHTDSHQKEWQINLDTCKI